MEKEKNGLTEVRKGEKTKKREGGDEMEGKTEIRDRC